MMSVIGPVQSHYHEGSPVESLWEGFVEKVGFEPRVKEWRSDGWSYDSRSGTLYLSILIGINRTSVTLLNYGPQYSHVVWRTRIRRVMVAGVYRLQRVVIRRCSAADDRQLTWILTCITTSIVIVVVVVVVERWLCRWPCQVRRGLSRVCSPVRLSRCVSLLSCPGP